MSSSAVLIVNPASGSYSEERLMLAVGLLRERFGEVSILRTGKRGDAEAMARDAAAKSPEMILSVGGDGTFNEVVNGTAFTDVPVAFVPAGTTNVLARELGLPGDIYDAVKETLRGRPEYVHLGRINGRYFVLMAGIGFDGEAVWRVKQGLKRISGKGAYVLSGLGCFLRYRPGRLRIVIDGRACEGYGLVACNSGYYAGSFRICRGAGLGSPCLHVSVMEGGRRSDLLRYVLRVVIGRPAVPACVEGRRIEVYGDAHIQVDGDYFGRTPAVITFHENALRLMVQ
ncbi:MAG TPA: diacylglycerol kinase family lipid kinase [Nitrospirae bacterium]|nr:diacylglycerol kinase family lipid kinase [Nitrospirota bacterium]